MATKVFQKDIWIARDLDEGLWGFFSKPEKNENGVYFSKEEDPDDRMFEHLYNRELTDIQKELNLTNINEPYKIKVKIIFEDLPDSSDSSSDSSEESSPTLEIKRAKEAVYTCCNCVLLTKKDYREILKKLEDLKKIENAYSNLKGAYFDLKGSLKAILNQFEE